MYDVTVVYPGAKGEHCPQDERDLLCDLFPEKIHFHIRRFQERGFALMFVHCVDSNSCLVKKREMEF